MDHLERQREALADALTERALRTMRAEIAASRPMSNDIAVLRERLDQIEPSAQLMAEANHRLDIVVLRCNELTEWLQAVAGELQSAQHQLKELHQIIALQDQKYNEAIKPSSAAAKVLKKLERETSREAGDRKEYLAMAHRIASIEASLGLKATSAASTAADASELQRKTPTSPKATIEMEAALKHKT